VEADVGGLALTVERWVRAAAPPPRAGAERRARFTYSGRKLRRVRSAKATVTCVALASTTTPRP
jgi:hypothetical protein